MSYTLLTMPGNAGLGKSLASRLGVAATALRVRRFPDGESYIRIETDVTRQTAIIVCSLCHPDTKILPLLFACDTARELGAQRVILVAPYLAYMRQDQRFKPGEAVSARCFARLLSAHLDGLVSVDPHLHRISRLEEVFSIPVGVVHAANPISNWIRSHIERPLIIGPDLESEQWVTAVARETGCPFTVLSKQRRGDRDVKVSALHIEPYRQHTPVIIDDIISTAGTMTETIEHVRAAGLASPVCIGVHAIFANGAYESLRQAGASQIITCNTIEHHTNKIDMTDPIADGLTTTLTNLTSDQTNNKKTRKQNEPPV